MASKGKYFFELVIISKERVGELHEKYLIFDLQGLIAFEKIFSDIRF
jgi:hypothetical protein